MSDSPDYQQLFQQQQQQNQQLLEQNKQLQRLIEKLQEQIEQLLRARFGKKSERQPKPKVPRNKLPMLPAESSVQSRALPANLARVDIVYEVPESEQYCPQCEKPLAPIKPITTEQYAYRPGSLYIKKHIRQRYACRGCKQTLITATLPNQAIDKGIADSSLLAQVLVDKYDDHLPLYRQERRWLRLGVAMPRQTLCDWAMASSVWLGYLVIEMKKDILAAGKIHSDDTVFPILAPGKTHQGRLWVYVGGGGNAPPVAVVYEYTPTRASTGPTQFLKGYRGYLQADAYAGYDALYQSGDIVEVACLAHARRKFVDAYESSSGSDAQAKSLIAIEFIGQLYHIESLTRTMTAQQRYYYRRHYAKPLLKQLHHWLKRIQPLTYPKLLLGKAIAYTLNHWRAFCHYCRSGILDIDNNVAERAIKPFVIGRKNYLFAGSHQGAKAAANIYSIIETCKMWNVNTYHYLCDVLARLPNTQQLDIRQLLPYHWKPSQ